jgi:hypothetical protein
MKAGLGCLIVCGMLTGCVSVTTAPPAGVVEPAATELPLTVPGLPLESDKSKLITPGTQTSPAVLKLLEQARGATLSGDLPRAEALLERSVRIEPGNPVLWHYLAKIRLQQDRFNEAAGLAQKSNALVKGDKSLQADNWRIIAHARNRNGDIAGAREAQDHVDALK